MRAKNEAKFLREAYTTVNKRIILERVVDGTLMCPEACCGAPVMECSCGPDCPHCNCFMIQEAVKKNGLEDKRLKIPEEDEEHRPSGWGRVTSSEDIDKIDLSKWKEYPAEDVMKAVYRQYGKELPSVDSYDWEFSWDKKVRPWLKNKFPDS